MSNEIIVELHSQNIGMKEEIDKLKGKIIEQEKENGKLKGENELLKADAEKSKVSLLIFIIPAKF